MSAPVRSRRIDHIPELAAVRNHFEADLFDRCYELLEAKMGFGRGILLWLLGVPIPIIILLALFWHH
jgi:hypothetical protein